MRVIDPASDEVVAEVDSADRADVAATVRRARAAQPGWAAVPLARRREIIGRFRTLVVERTEPLARLLARPSPKRNWRVTAAARSAQLDARLAASPADRARAVQALEAWRADIARFRATAGSALSASDYYTLGTTMLTLGDLYATLERRDDARTAWQAGLETMGTLTIAPTPPQMTLRAQLEVRLGRVQEARALADKVGATRYRHPAYADLQQRLAHATAGAPVIQGKQS